MIAVRLPSGSRRRWRAIVAAAQAPRERGEPPLETGRGTPHRATSPGSGLATRRRRLGSAARRRPRLAAVVTGGIAALVGTAAAGPVAGLVAAAYTAFGVSRVLRGATARRERAARTAAIDAVGLVAADLRAGVGMAEALAQAPALASTDSSTVDIRSSVGAAVELADQTGAPLAELLDRLDAELRTSARAELAAQAQVAGSRASALLLAVLPVAGVALGYTLDADPLRVLLHTPFGALCAIGAVALQLAGLIWSDRLAAGSSHVDTKRAAAPPGVRRSSGPDGARRLAMAGVAGTGAGLLAGGWFGVVVAVLATVAAYRWLASRPSPAEEGRRRQVAAALPYAVDLMAAVLATGAPPQAAAGLVGRSLGGELGQRLRHVERELAGGAPPDEAWAYLGDAAGAALLTRAATRSQRSGAALATAMRRLADDLRAQRLAEADAAARRRGVLVVLPLGLCFLPAFALAGLVPVVVAVLGKVLST